MGCEIPQTQKFYAISEYKHPAGAYLRYHICYTILKKFSEFVLSFMVELLGEILNRAKVFKVMEVLSYGEVFPKFSLPPVEEFS